MLKTAAYLGGCVLVGWIGMVLYGALVGALGIPATVLLFLLVVAAAG